MIVPNSKFIDSPVTNWTYGDPRVRFRIPVGVAYGSDVAKTCEALVAAGRENANTLDDPAPSVFLNKFGDNAIEFELVVWSSEMSSRPRRYRSDLNFAIERKIARSRNRDRLPQRDIHIRSGTLKVEGAGWKRKNGPSHERHPSVRPMSQTQPFLCAFLCLCVPLTALAGSAKTSKGITADGRVIISPYKT